MSGLDPLWGQAPHSGFLKKWLGCFSEEVLDLFTPRFVIVLCIYIILSLLKSLTNPLFTEFTNVPLYTFQACLYVHMARFAKGLLPVPRWIQPAFMVVAYLVIAWYTLSHLLDLILPLPV